MNQDTINQRFITVVNDLKKLRRVKSFRQLAEQLPINQGQLSSIMAGKKNAMAEHLNRLLSLFPDINSEWLLGHVNSPMYLEGNAKSLGQAIVQDYVSVPFIPAHVRASFMQSYINDRVIVATEFRQIHRDPRERYDKSATFGIEGDSMEPIYPSGCEVLADPVDMGDFKYVNSGVYIVCFDGHCVFKRIKENSLAQHGYLTLYSDNPNAGSLVVMSSELKAMWRVKRITSSPAR